MKAKMYYRETWPKELRIEVQNKEELEFLELLFSQSPKGILKKFTASEIGDIGLPISWKKKFIAGYDKHYEDEQYQTYSVFGAIEQEYSNMDELEEASPIIIGGIPEGSGSF